MLRRLSSLVSWPVHASRGVLGRVKTFYLDECALVVKYAAVRLIDGPQSVVLIPASTLVHADRSIGALLTALPIDIVRATPRLDERDGLSRAFEQDCLRHFGLPLSWSAEKGEVAECSSRSVHQLLGSIVRAVDGGAGFLEDLVVSAVNWEIRYLVVDTKNAILGGKSVAIPRSALCNSDWTHRRHCLTLSRHQIKAAPEAARTMSFTDEQRLKRYFADGPTERPDSTARSRR